MAEEASRLRRRRGRTRGVEEQLRKAEAYIEAEEGVVTASPLAGTIVR